MGDYTVLDIAVSASLDAKVTVTGAYDDAAACYFGGFVLTDNYARNLIRREKAPDNLYAIILLPQNASRGNINKLSIMSDFFINAFNLAEAGEYWKAMKLNGVLASAGVIRELRARTGSIRKACIRSECIWQRALSGWQ